MGEKPNWRATGKDRTQQQAAAHPDTRARLPAFAAAAHFLPDALSTLRELYTLFFTYLVHALQPLEPLVGRDAIRRHRRGDAW